MRPLFPTFVLCGALAACVAPPAPQPPLQVVNPNASIPFVDFQGIKSWERRQDGSLVLEGRNGRFYHATFFSPCTELAFSGTTIAINTGPLDSADRFSSIIVNGRTCQFSTLDEVIDPNSKASAAPTSPVEGSALPPPR